MEGGNGGQTVCQQRFDYQWPRLSSHHVVPDGMLDELRVALGAKQFHHPILVIRYRPVRRSRRATDPVTGTICPVRLRAPRAPSQQRQRCYATRDVCSGWLSLKEWSCFAAVPKLPNWYADTPTTENVNVGNDAASRASRYSTVATPIVTCGL
jgi:hypothetical protein